MIPPQAVGDPPYGSTVISHCEERSDEAISCLSRLRRDCHTPISSGFAMTKPSGLLKGH
ncbi:MAG: hypothetical protein V3S17_02940 [candidate division Zixibacteria bacterium]